MPPPGQDIATATAFATIRVGTCLAMTTDLQDITIVPCGGSHTDEVTLVTDMTQMFTTTPTNDQIQALNNGLCPAAAQFWTGASDPQYASGYVWHFDDGVPGQSVREFACTAQLFGHGPFLGTLRHAAS
jgi:hypothetical protein